MLEARRERVMLAAVAVLLVAVVADRLVVRPYRAYLDDVAKQTEEMRDRIRRVRDSGAAAAAARWVQPPEVTEQRQNEFRQFLEDQAGADVEVRQTLPVTAKPMPDQDGWTLLVCTLDLAGRIDPLRKVLQRLDSADRLLRVDKVVLKHESPETRMLTMTLTVSTVARSTEGS